MPTLVQQVNEKLNRLGKPEGGWHFEKSLGPLHDLTMEHVKGIYEILENTKDVKNILSFGARDGGFELTMQVRHDLDVWMGLNQKPGNSPSHNYLDAISLKKNRYTKLLKMEGLDVLKMQNPFWDIGYKNGIENADSMIFFITPEWLGSSFCRQEFQWLDKAKNKSIKAAFVIFEDVDKNNDTVKDIIDFSARNKSYILDATSDETLYRVSIEGSKDLSFSRSISSSLFEQIKKWLLAAPPDNR